METVAETPVETPAADDMRLMMTAGDTADMTLLTATDDAEAWR